MSEQSSGKGTFKKVAAAVLLVAALLGFDYAIHSPPHFLRLFGIWSSPESAEIVLGPGVVELRGDLEIGPEQRLLIRPGTTLRLHKGVGIYSRGPVKASGMAGAEIVIEAATAEPWGCLGIHGAATAGTLLAHVRVSGGSLGRHGKQDFRGMVNIYDCPGAVLRHCRFSENRIGDDTVNLVRSRIRVEDCHWEKGRSDGLDLSESRVLVRGAIFEGCGNGLSAGKGSQVVAEDCRFASSKTGMEVEKSSRLAALKCVFEETTVGLRVFAGGRALLVDGRFPEAARADLLSAEGARIELVRTPFKSHRGKGRLVEAAAISADWQAFTEGLRE